MFSSAKEDVPVSPACVRSFALAYSRSLICAHVFSSSFAKTPCRATIPCRASSSSLGMSLFLLLHHGCGPVLVDFLCHDCHDHVLGLAVLPSHVCGPFLIHHIKHNHVPGLLLLLLLRYGRGIGPVLLLCYTETTSDLFDDVCTTLEHNADLWRSYNKLMENLGLPASSHSWVMEEWKRE